jgi:CelD/BcsL family acetyltransferase involved in cellulose biosynthesis
LLRIKEIAPDRLSQIRDTWNSLAEGMRRPSPFCTWEWIDAWWRHFGGSYEPLILAVYEGERIDSILPLAVGRGWNKPGVTFGRTITLCGSVELAPDHLDLIGPGSPAMDRMELILDFLFNRHRDWDTLHFSHLCEDALLVRMLRSQGRPFTLEKASVAPYISLDGGFDKYVRGFSTKHRYNLKRQRNRLLESMGVSFSACDNDKEAEVRSTLEELFKLHSARKERVGLRSGFNRPGIVDFHFDVAERLRKSGRLRLSSLRNNGKAIAVDYGFVFGRRFSYYQSGIDPDWEKHSVGSSLLFEIIRESCEEGCVEFDFLRGDEDYKWDWTKSSRALYDVTLFNETRRGFCFRHVHELQAPMRRLIKRVLRGRRRASWGQA